MPSDAIRRTISGRKLEIAAICAMIATVSGSHAASAQANGSTEPVDACRVVGEYVFEDREFRLDVHLNGDGTSLYRVVTAGEDGENYEARGFWTISHNRIHMRNRPGPVRLAVAEPPTRDPSVGFSITARSPDGQAAEGIGASHSGALYMLGEGRHVVKPGEITEREIPIVRAADGLTLHTIKLVPGGPNSFTFVYHPSDEEPFDLEARVHDGERDMLEVELGIASVETRRVASPPGGVQQCQLAAEIE